MKPQHVPLAQTYRLAYFVVIGFDTKFKRKGKSTNTRDATKLELGPIYNATLGDDLLAVCGDSPRKEDLGIGVQQIWLQLF